MCAADGWAPAGASRCRTRPGCTQVALGGGEWERLAKGCVCPGLTAEVALLVVCPHQNLSGYLCSGHTLPSASRQMHSDPGSPWLWHTGKNALADK